MTILSSIVRPFFADLYAFLSFPDAQFFYGGDYNCVLNKHDKQCGNLYNGFDGKDEISTLMNDCYLVNFWRMQNLGVRTAPPNYFPI